VRSRTEGTAKPRAPLQCRIPCQACAASAFFCRPGSGAQSVGRRTVPSSKPTPRPKSTHMPGLDCHEFSSAPSHARMQTFGGRCSCTSSVRSTQTASSQQHSPQYSPRVRRPSNRRCSAARRGGTAPGRHGHQTTPCRKPWRVRVCRSTSRPAHPITELPPILSLNLDMSACLWRARKGMRSGPSPSSLPRGAVAGVAAAPAPTGVCATGRGVAAPPLLLVANIRARGVGLRGGARNPHWCDLDTPKVFRRPGTNFRYSVNLPLTFTFVPFSGPRPQLGHRAI
jgi:hypothetical protein